MIQSTASRPLHVTRLRFAIIGLLGILAGCGPRGGTDVGNGIEKKPLNVALEVARFDASLPTTLKSLNLESGVSIEQLYLAIGQVRLAPSSSCDNDDNIDLDGPFVVDLTGTGILGETPSFDAIAGTFCKLRVGYLRLDPASAPNNTPPEILNRSIFVHGTRTDGTPFTIISRRNDIFELHSKSQNGFSLPRGKNLLFLAYDIGTWIEAVDLDEFETDTIIIDEQTNDDSLEDFEEAVAASARLFHDADENGVLDASEQLTALAD